MMNSVSSVNVHKDHSVIHTDKCWEKNSRRSFKRGNITADTTVIHWHKNR